MTKQEIAKMAKLQDEVEFWKNAKHEQLIPIVVKMLRKRGCTCGLVEELKKLTKKGAK